MSMTPMAKIHQIHLRFTTALALIRIFSSQHVNCNSAVAGRSPPDQKCQTPISAIYKNSEASLQAVQEVAHTVLNVAEFIPLPLITTLCSVSSRRGNTERKATEKEDEPARVHFSECEIIPLQNTMRLNDVKEETFTTHGQQF